MALKLLKIAELLDYNPSKVQYLKNRKLREIPVRKMSDGEDDELFEILRESDSDSSEVQ
jgi:hypothetical protein